MLMVSIPATVTSKLRTVVINVEASDTIAAVKSKIQLKENIPSYQQRLVHSLGQELNDSRTLADHKIGNGSTILLNLPNHSIWIYVAMLRTVYKLEVLSLDTIYNVKYKIAGVAGIPLTQQRLTLVGKSDPLKDGRTVRDYEIEEGSQLGCSIDSRDLVVGPPGV